MSTYSALISQSVITTLYQRGIWSLAFSWWVCGPTRSSADVSVPRPRTYDDRTGRVLPDHLITWWVLGQSSPTSS